jgi:hypothetical protein
MTLCTIERRASQLLNEWDFIGIFDPDINTDEYDCMITPPRAATFARLSAAA